MPGLLAVSCPKESSSGPEAPAATQRSMFRSPAIHGGPAGRDMSDKTSSPKTVGSAGNAHQTITRRQLLRTLGAGAATLLAASCSPKPTPGSAETTPSGETSHNVYFGDLHLHTSLSHQVDAFAAEFSRASIDAANRYARDVVHHDFIAVTNHDWLLTDDMWQVEKDVADAFTEEGVFVSFPAFEWTASQPRGADCDPPRDDYPDWGHRNVYYRNTDVASLFRCVDPRYDSPTELFAALPKGDAFTVPHHTSAEGRSFDWSTFDGEYDRVVELVQFTGIYEEDLVQNGWSQGRVFGAVGGSDNHRGTVGGRGIAAVLASELTREALFDALMARRCFATTHGDVVLQFHGDEQLQGSVLSARSTIALSGDVESRSGDVSLVELVGNGAVVTAWEPHQGRTWGFEITREIDVLPSWYYVRTTLINGHQAWSSPIWVAEQGSSS